MLKSIKRESLPKGLNIYDSNWNRGIMIGNTIIFTARNKREVKHIKSISKKDRNNNGFYVEYKDEPHKVYIIYIRG